MLIKSQVCDPDIKDGVLQIAFATNDELNVDEHFGRAMQFLIYHVSSETYGKAGKIVFTDDPGDQQEKDHELKNRTRIEALEQCHIIYSRAIGGPVAARLVNKKIHPMVAKGEVRIEALLQQFQQLLGSTMPPWLRKIVAPVANPNRFDDFENDD